MMHFTVPCQLENQLLHGCRSQHDRLEQSWSRVSLAGVVSCCEPVHCMLVCHKLARV